ncbi:MAG: heavy metal translocating P-type ATPase [Actinomycetes bacterium]
MSQLETPKWTTTTAEPPRSAGGRPAAGSRPRVPERRLWALSEVRWAAAATVLFVAGAVAQLAGAPPLLWWALYLACYVAGGWEPGLAGLRALREMTLDVDLLMVVAAVGAAAIGQVFDGGLLIVIFATSGAMEAFATARTEDSVRSLLDLAPATATRIGAAGEETVAVGELQVGEEVLVRPGERIGADGEVVDGASDVDQATITGEPLPVLKTAGEEVFAGTLNGTGTLRVRVERPAADSVVARIVALVEQASATKAPTQLFIEKVEQRYSVGMVVATVALFAVPLALGADLQPTLLRAMTFMIVASPCAVVLATMPPLLAAIANAGRHGVLVKSAVVMEQLGTATRVVFDKTGTLTEGTPRVTEIRPVPDGPCDTDDLLALAAAVEHGSEHPVGRAIVRDARDAGIDLLPAEAFASIPGRGVTARVADYTIAVASPAHLLPAASSGSVQPGPAAAAAELVAELEGIGHTAVVLTLDGTPAGVLGLADRLRPEAARTVTAVARLTGAPPVLLTGDNRRAAARLADEVGISELQAGLLPQDKVSVVQDLQARGDRVLVVGDGVNDAPALAAAHLGLAMGGVGSDVTLETADAVITRDELVGVPTVMALSRRARRLVKQNLAIAATVIAVLVTWDIAGHLPLPLGVAGHEGSIVVVALNGLRLLRHSAWTQASQQPESPPGTRLPNRAR